MLDEERALVAQAQQDPEAFGHLYRRYVRQIYNYHYRHTGNVHEAEDLTSRTFFRALQHLPRYRDTGRSFQAWLFRIAHNLVVNWYRDHSRHPQVEFDSAYFDTGDYSEVLDRVAAAEQREKLVRAIHHLPEDRKTLIILKFVEQLSNAEIAVVLGRTEGAVKALYNRTLVHLRRVMLEGDTQ
jgi:RNA polymerase sigma-70 factor (ECF subfamily)